MDLFDARFANRWARRVVLSVVLLGIGLVAADAWDGSSTPPVSTVLGVQLTTTPGSAGNSNTDTTISAADLLAALGAGSTTTTGPTPPAAGSTTTSVATTTTSGQTTLPPPSSTTSAPATTTTRVPTTTTTTRVPTTTTTTTTTTTLPPTTTTTVPATTTTTTPSGEIGVFVSALIPGGSLVDPLWEPSVQVRLGLTTGSDRRDIQVEGLWSAFPGPVFGTSNPSGRVNFDAPAISDENITFTVVKVTHGEYVYRPELNVVEQIVVTRADAE